MQKIIFHIGDVKTGSTSIQRALLRQGWSCERFTLAYPVPAGQPYHHRLAMAFRRKNEDLMQKEFMGLRQKMEKAGAAITVVSTELFERVPANELKAAIDHHMPEYRDRIWVLAYVRPHAERLVSSWSQTIKLGSFTGSLEEFFERALRLRRFLYTPRFLGWREHFGERFELRAMIRDRLYNRDVVQDFFQHVFEGAEFTLATGPNLNETIGIADLAMLRSFHAHPRLPKTKSARMQAGQYLSYILEAAPTSRFERPALHRTLLEKVVETYREDARNLDDAFFAGNPMLNALEQAHEKAVENPQSLKAEDHFDAETLRCIQAWSVLLHDILKSSPAALQKHLMRRINHTLRGGAPADG